jgi:hypothetical protein
VYINNILCLFSHVSFISSLTFDLFSEWVRPDKGKKYYQSPNIPIKLITGDNESGRFIHVRYTLTVDGVTDKRWFGMRCESGADSKWSYIIGGCTCNSYNVRFLDNVPVDKLKLWTITKTSTHLKVVCNKVTVLNFNFANDCDSDKKDGVQLWSRNSGSFEVFYNSSSLSMRVFT